MMQIESKYLSSLGRLFSPLVMDEIIQNNRSGYLRELLSQSGITNQIDMNMPLSRFMEDVYRYLFDNYRNEYIYKNAIANKILLGRHSLNTTNMLTEFRIRDCKADVVMINGNMTVYEIKTGLDTFNRLENQIRTYFDFFEFVNVLTSADQVFKLQKILHEDAGILILSDKYTLQTVRKAQRNTANIKQEVLFDSLRKPEYLRIIQEYYNTVPDVPNTVIFKECRKLFCCMPKEAALNLVKKALRARRNEQHLKTFIDSAPDSLSAYGISISENKQKMSGLTKLLALSLCEVIKQ